ncbi:MAG: hypothetical protein AAB368_03245 [bacterium]
MGWRGGRVQHTRWYGGMKGLPAAGHQTDRLPLALRNTQAGRAAFARHWQTHTATWSRSGNVLTVTQVTL